MLRAALIILFGVVVSCPCTVIDMAGSAQPMMQPGMDHRDAGSHQHRTIAGDACSRSAPASISVEQTVHAVVERGAWMQRRPNVPLVPESARLPFVAPDTARALLQVYRL